MKKIYIKTLLVIISLFALSSCNSINDVSIPQSGYENSSYTNQTDNENKIASDQNIDNIENTDNLGKADVNANTDRIEKFYQITTQTDKYDEDYKAINSHMKKEKGYIESSNLSISRDNNLNNLRNYYAVIKIPKDNSDNFLNEIQKIGKLNNLNSSSNNLNQTYTNVEIRLKSKKTELDKLNELMDKAQSLEDTMAIQSRILEVQSEIDEIEAQLRELNNRVTYDTFNINLIEVYKYGDYVSSDPNLWERLKEAFKNSIDIFINLISEILVAIATLWPLVLILGVFIYFLLKKNKKNK